MNSSLRVKFGGLIVLVVAWCILMMYLVTSLEFGWMPPLPLLHTLEHSSSKGTDNRATKMPIPTYLPRLRIMSQSVTEPHPKTTTHQELLRASAVLHMPLVQVVMASDSRNLGGLIATVNSVLSNTKHSVKFHIVITEEDLSHLKSWIQSTKLHKMLYEVHTLSSNGNKVTTELRQVKANFGLIFPDLEGRVVYLDTDVIVQGDIWELFSVAIVPGTYGAFAQDCSSSSYRVSGSMGRPRYATFINMKHSRVVRLKIDGSVCPFTAGVFVANISEWRDKGIFEQLQQWMEIHADEPITGIHPGVDEVEAAMLIEFYRKVTVLDPLWHVQHLGASLSSRYSKQFIERAKLLHWSGHFKPWRHWAVHAEQWDRFFVPDPTLQFRPSRRRG